jgi:hypothetical protein
MAWVRIHDGALSHPKLCALFSWRDPLHVWIWGLTHSQMHLTDGLIARDTVPAQGRKAVEILIARGLWDLHDAGWKIHDFSKWNDTRAKIQKARKASRVRLSAWRMKQQRNAVSNGRETPTHATPRHATTIKNPPTPRAVAQGASRPRLTRDLRKQSERVLSLKFGHCPHDPACANREACVQAIADEIRAKVAS